MRRNSLFLILQHCDKKPNIVGHSDLSYSLLFSLLSSQEITIPSSASSIFDIGVWRSIFNQKIEKAFETDIFVKLTLGLIIRDVIQSLQYENFGHQNDILWGVTTCFPWHTSLHGFFQDALEHFKIDDIVQTIKRISRFAEFVRLGCLVKEISFACFHKYCVHRLKCLCVSF